VDQREAQFLARKPARGLATLNARCIDIIGHVFGPYC
jgi:hypothetical protein